MIPRTGRYAVRAMIWMASQPANQSFTTKKLSEETLKTLDGIFPGPGGAAPEAYAW